MAAREEEQEGLLECEVRSRSRGYIPPSTLLSPEWEKSGDHRFIVGYHFHVSSGKEQSYSSVGGSPGPKSCYKLRNNIVLPLPAAYATNLS